MPEIIQNILNYLPEHPMVFNSVIFFTVFTIFYGIYSFCYNNIKLRNILLLLFSIFFYYKVGGISVIIMLLMASSDYLIGLGIFSAKKESSKKYLMLLSVLINAGSLFFFKYINFLIHTCFDIAGFETQPPVLHILLPIGISFFAFRSLSYIFDLYRDMIEEPEKSWINYTLYISFFPLLLAGPIAKARNLLPQLREKIQISQQAIGMGFILIMSGVIKKYMISDYISVNLVDRIFITPQYFSGFEILMGSYGALIQIFCDFSGYTDIVIGIAMLLGFTIEKNFNKPYLADNVTDFWRRWHITLSQWMSEYLFTPLSYSFRALKKPGVIIAILLTFTISGLWHGPHWAFILWGLTHGLAMVWDVLTSDLKSKISQKIPYRLYRFISILLTFNFLALTVILFKAGEVILFRSADPGVAGLLYTKIFTAFNISIAPQWFGLYILPFLMMVFGFLIHYFPQNWNNKIAETFIRMNWVMKSVTIAIVIIFVYQTLSAESLPFIYLEF